MRTCKRDGCESIVTGHSSRLYCADCPPGMRGTCEGCGTQIRTISSFCRACFKEKIHTPDFKEKHREAVKTALNQPEVKARLMANRKKRNITPERREQHRAAAIAMWKDPEYRKKHRAAMAKVYKDPEFTEKRRAVSKALWENEEHREKHREGMRKWAAKSAKSAKRKKLVKVTDRSGDALARRLDLIKAAHDRIAAKRKQNDS